MALRTFKLTAYIQIETPNSDAVMEAAEQGADVNSGTTAEAIDYVTDALSGWGGGFHPADPFFGPSVLVKSLKLLHNNPNIGEDQ